jgi:hypothetical protein
MGASYLTDIINCQTRKENPNQTLSDFRVNFHDVLPPMSSSWTCGTRKSRLLFPLLLPEILSRKCRSSYVTEERKFAILFAATILAARKLIDMDPNKPNMAKGYFVDRAIDDAVFILERIDARWPAIVNTFSVKP